MARRGVYSLGRPPPPLPRVACGPREGKVYPWDLRLCHDCGGKGNCPTGVAGKPEGKRGRSAWLQS